MFQIVISGGESSVNNSVTSSVSEVTLFVSGMAAGRAYSIAIAASNREGRGPFSAPLEVVVDPMAFEPLSEEEKFKDAARDPDQERLKMLTWLIVVAAAACFALILALVVVAYRRRMFSSSSSSCSVDRKPLGYLEAASSDDFHHSYRQHQHQHHQRPIIKQSASGRNLWIDGGWREEEEKESNSSEKKLLHPAPIPTHSSSSNSDTEYTYVDRQHLMQQRQRQHFQHSSSSSAGSGGSGRSRNMMSMSHPHPVPQPESPEPYATTDIFNRDDSNYGDYPRPEEHHYAAASVVNGSNRRRQQQQHHYGGGGSRRCYQQPQPQTNSKEAYSCTDLSRRPSGRNNGNSTDRHLRRGNTGRSSSSSRASKSANSASSSSSAAAANLLDILPPPPSHPPPPPAAMGASQESVISPRFLFQHPAYQSAQRQLSSSSLGGGHYHRPASQQQQQQQKRQRVRPSEEDRQYLGRGKSEDVFKRLLPDQHRPRYDVIGGEDDRLLMTAPPVDMVDRDLENELQIFNDAVTKFSSGLGTNGAKDDSLSCDADEEDEEDETSS